MPTRPEVVKRFLDLSQEYLNNFEVMGSTANERHLHIATHMLWDAVKELAEAEE